MTLERSVKPGLALALVLVSGTGGTVGYARIHDAEHETEMARERAADVQQHCVERQLDWMRGVSKP
jgi:hypothetical protein